MPRRLFSVAFPLFRAPRSRAWPVVRRASRGVVLVLGMALLTATGLVRAAPAAPPPSVMPVANDGYITVMHDGADLNSSTGFMATDKVCPLGAGLMRSWRSGLECENGTVQPWVHVQDVLDQRFGKGRAQAVGYAPVNANETVVFVRLLP